MMFNLRGESCETYLIFVKLNAMDLKLETDRPVYIHTNRLTGEPILRMSYELLKNT